MNEVTNLLMQLIKSEISDYVPNKEEFQNLSEEDWKKLRDLAVLHSIEQMAGDAALRFELVPFSSVKEAFEADSLRAVYRYRNMNFELSKICRILDDEEIEYIPLKGAVIRGLYPKPWMRSSTDIDLFIKKEDVDRAFFVCKKELGATCEHETTYDRSFVTDNKISIELHFGFSEDGTLEKSKSVLKNIWENTERQEGSSCRSLTSEMLYYYQILHMAKHFLAGGGCGIRSVLDLFIINKNLGMEITGVYDKLYVGGLLTFEKAVKNICEHWFAEKELSETEKNLETRIIASGTHGDMKGFVRMNMGFSGSKLKYALSRLWIPYHYLYCEYPALKGRRILQPLYEVRRWGKLLNPKTRKNSFGELRSTEQQSEEIRETQELIKAFDLQ